MDLSPREFAKAIGVSESSVKRWIDAGRLRAERTPGGHRRIPFEVAVSFAETFKGGISESAIRRAIEQSAPDVALTTDAVGIHRTLLSGDRSAFVGLIEQMLDSGMLLHEIYDGPLSSAMHELGALWRQRPDGVMLEHRATFICETTMRGYLRQERECDGRKAIGCAGPGEGHGLPSLMVASALSELGYLATDLGPSTPMVALAQAIDYEHPVLAWVSVTMEMAAWEAQASFELVTAAAKRSGSMLIVGGNAASRLPVDPAAGVMRIISLGELDKLARSLRAPDSRLQRT